LLTVGVVLLSGSTLYAAETPPPKLDSGDTAWVLVATGLVMLMVPGLALFYGGLVRRKNLLGTMMQSMVALSIVGVQWLLIGYAMAFGESRNGFIGWSADYVGLNNVLSSKLFPGTNIPIYVHCMFQGMFAIITPALISGALAERIRFGPYCLFILLWAVLVYNPVAHWVWAVNADGKSVGLLGGGMNAIDFAGGTVVHVAAGVSALAAILVLRKRLGYPGHAMHPNSVALSLLGAGLLWFGWFGFNGGSALASNGLAGAALTATQVAAAGAALCWIVIEWLHRGKPTGLGFATGLVAGLVAVTPASGYVYPLSALTIGVLAGGICYLAVFLKAKLKYDDSLDAFGVHGVGGAVGAVLTGVFASAVLWKAGSGSTDDLGALGPSGTDWLAQVVAQVKAVAVTGLYAFTMTVVLVKLIDLVWGFCLDPQAEGAGLDLSEHGEAAFDHHMPVEEAPEHAFVAPRPASVPPNGKQRFTVVLEGAPTDELHNVWSDLFQAGQPAPAELRTVYPFVTTVQGNRFRFRGGDPGELSGELERLFTRRLAGRKVHARVETLP
jgi:ammonium transporter